MRFILLFLQCIWTRFRIDSVSQRLYIILIQIAWPTMTTRPFHSNWNTNCVLIKSLNTILNWMWNCFETLKLVGDEIYGILKQFNWIMRRCGWSLWANIKFKSVARTPATCSQMKITKFVFELTSIENSVLRAIQCTYSLSLNKAQLILMERER